MDLETLYLKLPVPLQTAACSLVGLQTEVVRYGGAFPELLRRVQECANVSNDEIVAFRDTRLRSFVEHCARTVPYYVRQFREIGIEPRDIRSLEDLQYLPILTKEGVQDHAADLVSTAVPSRKQIAVHTSGTTGGGLRFATTLAAIQEQWATWWRYRRWHGIDRGTWCALFAGRSVVPLPQREPPFWRANYFGKQILFSAYHMSPRTIDLYLLELRRRRIPWFHGYPSLLALLAERVLDVGFDLGYSVRWITTGAENLLAQQAAVIERAFGIRPRQHYGMAEAVANISECPGGSLHVDEDFAATEFVALANGQGSRIVGTNLTNLATPLLRYDVQDVAFGEATCACGRPGRVVASIDGRLEDYIVLRSGAVLGRLDHIFKDLVNVREAQIYQQVPGDIIVRVVRGPAYGDKDEVLLLHEARKRVGTDTTIHINYVDAIDRSPTGKLRFVVSEVQR